MGIINFSKEVLIEFAEVKGAKKLDITNPSDCILIAEAINWSAKVSNDLFYLLKPVMIVASAKNGAKIGIESDGNSWDIYYLFDKSSGVASFHDPGGEVNSLFSKLDDGTEVKDWEFGWSGISRQEVSYYLISEKEKLYLQRMRYNTLPGKSSKEKKHCLMQ